MGGVLYVGPSVSTVERKSWRAEVKKGTSTGNFTDGDVPGRSHPLRTRRVGISTIRFEEYGLIRQVLLVVILEFGLGGFLPHDN